MATWPAYKAGSARITLKPILASTFKSDAETLLEPIKVDLKVVMKPELSANFKSDLEEKAKTAATGAGTSIVFKPKLAVGFRKDLSDSVAAVAKTLDFKVIFSPKLSRKFKGELKTDIGTATTGVSGKVTVKADVDLTAATAQLDAWRALQGAIPLTMNVNLDTGAAMAQLLALRTLAGAIGNQVSGIGTNGVGRALGRSSRRGTISGLITRPIQAIKLQVEVDKQSVARAQAEVANLAGQMAQAQQKHADAIDKTREAEVRHQAVMGRSTSTYAQQVASSRALARARRAEADALGDVTGLMGRQADARDRLTRNRRDQNSLSRLFAAGFNAFGEAVTDLGARMFSFRNVTSLATVALVGLAAVSLVPLLGQLSQALGVVGLLPAGIASVGAALATVVIGSRGIGDAFSAATKVKDKAADDAETKAKAIKTARKAETTAARQVEDANRGVASAERTVRDAQKTALQTQKDLTKARKEATEHVEDLNRALGKVALTEESAAISVAEAQRNLYQTFLDPNSDAIDRARAQNSVKQALADQDDLRFENKRLAAETAEANEKGVEGSDSVVEAKDKVTDATEAEVLAQEALQESYDRLADAQTALVEAQQETTAALNEQSDAAKEFDRAMQNLTPNARAFVQAILDLRESYGNLRRDVQESLFDKMGESITNLANRSLPTLRTGLTGIADQINQSLRRALADLATDASQSKLATIFENTRLSIGPLLDGVNNLLQGFLSLSEAGSDLLPGLSGGFLELTERFRKWAEDPENQQKFKDFLRESLDTLKEILDVVGKLGGFINRLFKGSDETGEGWLHSMSETLDRWNKFLDTPKGQEDLKKFFDDVSNAVNDVSNAISTLVGWMGKLKSAYKDSPLQGVLGLFDSDKSAGQKAAGVGQGIKTAVWDYGPLGWIGKPAVGGAKEMIDDAKGAIEGFGNWVGENAPKIGGWFADIGTDISKFGTDAVSSITGGAKGAWDGLVGALPDWGTQFGDFTTDIGDKFDAAKLIFSNVATYLTGDQVLGKVKDAFGSLVGWFGDLVSNIGKAWDSLPSKLEAPINAVIDILNRFGDLWNKVAGKLGLPKWDPIESTPGTGFKPQGAQPIPGRAKGGPGYFDGKVDGPGNRFDDKAGVFRLARGEHVWTADEVDAFGGHERMYQARRAVLDGAGKQSRGDGYRDGGGIVTTGDPLDPVQAQLWDLVRSAIPAAVLTSAKRFQDVGSGFDMHMQGKAIDLGGPMDQIAQWIYNTYPQSYELIHWPLNGWQNLKNGAPLQYDAATNAAHQDHVHWSAKDFLGPLSEEERKSFFDRVRSGIGAIVSGGRSALVDNLLGGPLRSLANQVPTFDGLGEFGQIPRAFAQRMADQVIGWASGQGGGGASYIPSAGVEQWRNLAIEAMRREGFNADDPAQVNAMLSQIGSESGGNPNILQQVDDINSRNGQHAQGLLQVIPGTFAAFRDPALPDDRTDPLANMVAALRYYKSRHGNDLTKEWGHGHGYDQGGVLKHKGWGINLSGLPEAVLTNRQWRLFDNFVEKIPGFNDQLGALPDPLDGGTDENGDDPGTFDISENPTVDNSENPTVDASEAPKVDNPERIPGFNNQLKPLPQAFNSQLKALPQPLNGGTDSYGNPGLFGVPSNPGVDTWQTLGKKTQDRFKSAAETGFSDFWESNLGFLGIPNPTSIPLVEQGIKYAGDLDAWEKARQANAQASQALAESGYQPAVSPAPHTAPAAIRDAGGSVDNSTTINIYPADVNEAFRKAEQIKEVRALTNTARGGR